MPWLWTLVQIFAALLVLAYVCAPLLIALSFRQRADDRVVRLRADAAETPDDAGDGDADDVDGGSGDERDGEGDAGAAGDALGDAPSVLALLPSDLITSIQVELDRLGELGFEEVGWYRHQIGTQPIEIIIAVSGCEEERLVALVAAAIVRAEHPGGRSSAGDGDDGGARLQSLHVEIACEAVDGREFATSNASALLPAAALGERFLLQVPQIADAALLCQIQRELVRYLDLHQAALRPVPRADEWTDELTRSARRHIDNLAAAGLLAPTATDDMAYRPTWRGAIVLSWSILWPISAIRRWVRDRRAGRVLDAIGLSHLRR
ncbi:MAG: hypothetical protein Tsb0020_48230 [Haliangiales bacterium]